LQCLTQVALRRVMQKGALPLAGASKAKTMRSNAEALAFELSRDDVAALDRVAIHSEGHGVFYVKATSFLRRLVASIFTRWFVHG